MRHLILLCSNKYIHFGKEIATKLFHQKTIEIALNNRSVVTLDTFMCDVVKV